MHVSMDPSCHYVTQQGLFTSPLKGPLTDRRIAYYAKRGWYSGGRIVPEKRKLNKRTKALKAILDLYA